MEELKVQHLGTALGSNSHQFMPEGRSALPTAGHPSWGKAITQLGDPIALARWLTDGSPHPVSLEPLAQQQSDS
ncbi:MAG: hypothetical protein AAGF66_05420 [Cyanobacteria bacterium P01_H01_bin.119]